jgi:TonB family protein
MGSPFLTYPVWQPGTVQLDKSGKSVDAELAYNLATNQVMSRFTDDMEVKITTPEAFTINGVQFNRPQSNLPGKNFRAYLTTIHDGPTKLLKSLSSYLGRRNSDEIVRSDVVIDGIYRITTDYYIQKADLKPELINLTKSSLVSVLYEQKDKLAARLPANDLTINDVTAAIRYYDSLMAVDRSGKLPLLADPVFTQVFHDNLSYPNYARTQGIYGRVYIAFDVNEQGQIKNIATLSPENGGYRFDTMVKNVLEKMPSVNPACKGRYVLPIAFTFTNAKETTPNVPVNHLPTERLGNRTLLEEFVVNSTGFKPDNGNKEVWGYFK